MQHKIYFPNLNGLRFIAAFLVIVHHIEQIKSISQIDNYWEKLPFIHTIGKLGVVLFFVLSGFLITFLLLQEEHRHTKINIRKFYMRRILRIWPLYFTIIILALAILPNISVFKLPSLGKDIIYKDLFLKVILFVLLMPNMVLSLLGSIPYASHTWSIGAEEQYYIIWPVVLRLLKKYRLNFMIIFILSCLLVTQLLLSNLSDPLPHKKVITALWQGLNISCMAIGALFSILLFEKKKVLSVLLNPYLFYCVLIITVLMMFTGQQFPYINYEIYSVLFGIIILNFAANKESKLSLEHRFFRYMGKVSYGLYMYHPIGIVLAIYFGIAIDFTSNWFIYPSSMIITTLIAAISFKYFESYFLKKKEKYDVNR